MSSLRMLAVCLAVCFLPLFLNAQNENLSEGLLFDGEPYLLSDPANSQHLVVCWMGAAGLELIKIKVRVSFDGGNSWSDPVAIPHAVSGYTSADPSMGINSDGRIFLCYVDYNTLSGGGDYIVHSDDGGLTWSEPMEILDRDADPDKAPVDRPWMVVDNTGGPTDGNIYVTSKPAPWIPPPNRNYFIASTDGGNTWSTWRNIDTAGWSIGPYIQAPMAAPAISSGGIFFCVYPAFLLTESFYPRYIIASTGNAGVHFDHQLALNITSGPSDTLGKYGYRLAADPTDLQRLAFVYYTRSYGDVDISMIETSDGGASWSAPVRVNDDAEGNGADQDLVWANYNTNGDLLISWRDRRNAPDTGYATSSEIWGSVRWKDSLDFSPNFRISDTIAQFEDVLLGNGNDFMCNRLIGDTLCAVWGDTRNGILSIWFAKMNARTGLSTGIQNLALEPEDGGILFPNPVTDMLHYILPGVEDIRIYDMKGALRVHAQPAKNSLDVSKLNPGYYIILFTTDSGEVKKAFIKQ